LPNLAEFVGKVSSFDARTIIDGLRAPFEGSAILTHIAEVGYKSLPLVAPTGFALGTVMAFQTRSTLVAFGASAMIPTVQPCNPRAQLYPESFSLGYGQTWSRRPGEPSARPFASCELERRSYCAPEGKAIAPEWSS
jgi:hypothetical protein